MVHSSLLGCIQRDVPVVLEDSTLWMTYLCINEFLMSAWKDKQSHSGTFFPLSHFGLVSTVNIYFCDGSLRGILGMKTQRHSRRSSHSHFISPNTVDVSNVEHVRFGCTTVTCSQIILHYITLHTLGSTLQLFMINLKNSPVPRERKTRRLALSQLLHIGGISSCGSVVFVFCWSIFYRGLPFMRSHKHLRIIKQQHSTAVKPRQDGQSKSF